MKFKTLIVEDSRLAQNELLRLCAPYSSLAVVGQAKTLADAIKLIRKTEPDLLLLDINLPDGTGFDLLDQLQWVPQVIFTTAYDEFAIQAFERNALDYLLKPISEKRFNQAVEKLNKESKDEPESGLIDHKIFVKDNDRCWLIDIQQVRYFQSQGNHSQIHFDDHKPMVYRPLSQIEQRLPEKQFFNCVKHIEAYGNSGLLLTMDDGHEIDVSRRHSSHLKQALSL